MGTKTVKKKKNTPLTRLSGALKYFGGEINPNKETSQGQNKALGLTMLARKNRISTKIFPKTGRPWKNITSDSFSLSIFSQTGSGILRASVIVSKKVARTAVPRNKIRRRIYSILRKEISACPQNMLLVCYVKKPALEKSFSVLETELKHLLRKI